MGKIGPANLWTLTRSVLLLPLMGSLPSASAIQGQENSIPADETTPVLSAAFVNPATGIRFLKVKANGEATLFHQDNPKVFKKAALSIGQLEHFRAALVRARFCDLNSYRKELSNHTSIEVAFPGLRCKITRPDSDWRKDARSRRVIDALSELQKEVCGGSCPDMVPY